MANKHNEKQKQNNIMKYLDNKIVQLVLIYLAWIVAHYVAAHLYVCVCVPTTLWGFMMSPISVASPHCQGLSWFIYNSGLTICNMWLLLGAWIISKLVIFRK